MLSSSSISPSNSLLPQLPWNTKPRTPRTQTLSYSLATSYGQDFQGTHISGSGDGDGSPFIIHNSGKVSGGDVEGTQKGLPVVFHKSGKVSRYVWDGNQLHLVSLDGDSFNRLIFDNGFHRFYHFCASAVWDFFIPYKVQRNYLDYVKWKLLHRVFSSALHALATQSFIHRSFAKANNLGEISAKLQIQTACFDILGLMLAELLKNYARMIKVLPFVVYPFFSAMELFGIYQALKHVHLQTLTKKAMVNQNRMCCSQESLTKVLNAGNVLFEKSGFLLHLPGEFHQGSCKKWTTQGGILLCLREGATTVDIIMGLFQACHIRKALQLDRNKWERVLEAKDVSESVISSSWMKRARDALKGE